MHECQTAQVWKLPLEFYGYYETNKFPFRKKYPFLLELMQLECLENDAFFMEDLEVGTFQPLSGNELKTLVPNPEIKILPLQYPVHIKKIKDITENDKAQYFASIHRNFYTKQTEVFDLPLSYVEMLVKINDESASIADLKELYSKYETDGSKIAVAVDGFLAFAMENNMLLGEKP